MKELIVSVNTLQEISTRAELVNRIKPLGLDEDKAMQIVDRIVGYLSLHKSKVLEV